MTEIDSRAGLQAVIASIESDNAAGPKRPLPELIARLALTTGIRRAELMRAVAVELRLQDLERSLDLSNLTVSHIRELRRIQPDRAETIDEVARTAVIDSLTVRALRALVHDNVRGQAAHAPTAREAAFRDAIDFERSAFAFVAANKTLFADARAMLAPQPRGSNVAVDFVLKDGTGVLVAFECKRARKPPQPRQILDLVGTHALFARKVGDVFGVFSAADMALPGTYRHFVETFALERLHTLTLDFDTQDSSLCRYRIHCRAADGWHESDGEGILACGA